MAESDKKTPLERARDFFIELRAKLMLKNSEFETEIYRMLTDLIKREG